MTAAHLRTLWTAIGVVLAFYALNAFLSNRGMNPIFDLKLLEDRRRLESLFAIPICSLMLIVVARIGRAYAELHPNVPWHERLPIVWLDGLDTGSPEGKRYQAAFLLLFVVLPSMLLAHFFLQLMGTSVSPNRDGGGIIAPWVPVPWETLLTERYIIGEELALDKQRVVNGVEWFPVIQPILFCMLVLWAWGEVARMLFSVFKR